MTKDNLYKACKQYADEYVKKNLVLPRSENVTDGWDKADFLKFRAQASRVASQVDLDIKSVAGKVSDKVYEELILSVGGERG